MDSIKLCMIIFITIENAAFTDLFVLISMIKLILIYRVNVNNNLFRVLLPMLYESVIVNERGWAWREVMIDRGAFRQYFFMSKHHFIIHFHGSFIIRNHFLARSN